MVSMSPRKAAPTHISIPARILSLTRSRGGSVDSTDSNPCTPSPRTPLPYSCEYISGALRLDSPLMTPTEAPMPLFPGTSTTLAKGKRAREEDEAKVEAWADEDIELVRATVLHPFRPLSSAYPPGELAPPHILDEITTQIVNCSSDQRLLSSKARRALTRSRALAGAGSLAGDVSSSPITRSSSASSSASIESPTSTSSGSSGSSGSLTPQAPAHVQSARWPHSWEATRRRVYLASVEATREAHGLIMHKEEKREKNRPGLRRVDSMDFLDQVDMEDDQEGQGEGGVRSGLDVPALGEVGRAMRLSTTLQNSTKFSPSPMLLRSASMGSGLNVLSTSSSTSSSDQPMPVRPASPIRASTGSIGPILTLTPASPQKAPTRKASAPVPSSGNTNSNLIPKQKATAQAQVPSIRKNRTPRPSLLQRGRSFTASDLGSFNGDASDEEAGGEQDEANDGAGAAKGKGKSLSSPNTPWQGAIPLGMGMTSMTSLSALSAPAPAASVAESSRRPSTNVNVDYDTSPMTLSAPVIPAQPFIDDGDSLMCDSPPNLSPTKGRVDKSLPAGFGLGLPTSASAPLLASSLFPSPTSTGLQAHLTSPPSPRTRRRSQALGNELSGKSASLTPTSTSSGLEAGAMIEDTPTTCSARSGAKHEGWSDTDDDADAGSDSGHGRTRKRAMKRHVSNNKNCSSGSRSDKVHVEMGKGAGIGRSGSMAYLKQTCAGEDLTFGSALGVGASRESSGKAGLASPFDENTGFLL